MPQWLPLAQVEPFAPAIRRMIAATQAQATPPSPLIPGMPPLPTRRPFLPRRLIAPIIGVSIVGVVAVVLALVLWHSGPSGNVARGDAAALAEIISDYATRLKGTQDSPKTEIQRQDAVAAAIEEFKTRVNKVGTIAFTGKVQEIIQEGPMLGGQTRDRWGISMDVPQELEPLVRAGTCTFGCKVWVRLERTMPFPFAKATR